MVLPGAACFSAGDTQAERSKSTFLQGSPRSWRHGARGVGTLPCCSPCSAQPLPAEMSLGALSRPVWKPGGYYKVRAAFSLFLAWWCTQEPLRSSSGATSVVCGNARPPARENT